MTLDDRLFTIFYEVLRPSKRPYPGEKLMRINKAIRLIKQAFENEGYKLYNSKFVTEHERRRGGYLTGSEWYDRFVDAFEDKMLAKEYGREHILDAAKRASGSES